MEQPKDKAPVDLSSVDAINNLDTARMALRWALEKLHSLEKSKNELTEKVQHEARMRAKVEEDYQAQNRSHALHAAEENQRQLYYKKLEELVSLRLAGQLDLTALLKREADAAQLQQILDTRQVHLEKEYLAKRESLELEYQRLSFEAREQAKERERKTEESLVQRRINLDKEYVDKLNALREMDVRLKQREKALDERQARFDEFSLTQRVQLESDVKTFREDADEHLKIRLEASRKLLDERHFSLEESWRQEKAILQQELNEWRRKANEQFPRIVELETKLAESEERSKASLGAAERRFLEGERVWSEERAAMLAEAEDLRGKLRDASQRVLDLEKAWAHADEQSRQTRSLFERQEVRLKDFEQAWSQEKSLLLAELEAAQRKTQEVQDHLLETQRLATAAQESARQSRQESERQGMRLEELKLAWDSEKSAWLAELASAQGKADEFKSALEEAQRRSSSLAQKEDELERLKASWVERLETSEKKASAHLERALELEKSVLALQQSLGLARAESERLNERLAGQQQAAVEQAADRKLALEESELARQRERARWLEEAARFERSHQELTGRCHELEGRLQAAVEAAGASSAQAAQSAALMSEREKTWAAQKELLIREQEDLKRKELYLEKRLQSAREEMQAAQGQAAQRTSFLEDREKSWQEEKSLLLQETGEWRQKAQTQLGRIFELEKGLAAGDQIAASARMDKQQLEERLALEQRTWEDERAAVKGMLERAEGRFLEELANTRSMEQRVASLEDALKEARKESQGRALHAEERAQIHEQAKEAWSAELARWEKKTIDQATRMFELERKLAEAEEAAHLKALSQPRVSPPRGLLERLLDRLRP